MKTEHVGRHGKCPQCGETIAITEPAAKVQAQHEPPDSLGDEAPRKLTLVQSPTRPCPWCATLPESSVICVQCGLDIRSGDMQGKRTLNPRFPMTWARWLGQTTMPSTCWLRRAQKRTGNRMRRPWTSRLHDRPQSRQRSRKRRLDLYVLGEFRFPWGKFLMGLFGLLIAVGVLALI